MRRILFSLTLLAVAVIVFGSTSIPESKAKVEATVVPQSLGRCTRLTFGPKQKKKSKEQMTAMPGTRCARLAKGGKPGSILPNTAPNLGLASSTAHIAATAGTTVNLMAIACDADGDNLLYTYSTTGGRISGEGASAVWDLSGAARPANYTASVEVDDGCGCISFTSAVVTLE